MDRQLYEEMTRNLEKLDREQGLTGRQIFLFGHCSAAEELADMLLDRGQTPAGFLDNNGAKHGKTYRGIKILPPQEVLARVQAGMRRCQKGRPMEEKLSYKRLVLYPEARKAVLAGKELALTAHEYDILLLLVQHPDKVYSRESLYELVWQGGYYGENNTVNVHVSNIRKKIKEADPFEEYIQTVYGIGFKLS